MGKKVDVTFFGDYEKVKERLCFRLVNRERNKEMLKAVPYIPILDLAICFYYSFEGCGVENGMIQIHRSHMENWKVTEQDLLECAVRNTPKILRAAIIPMENALEDILKDLPEEIRQDIANKVSMLILTNARKTYGAGSILYPGMLEHMTELLGDDFYLIPSSVHEFILFSRDRVNGEEELRELISEVNQTEISPEEVLSDHLYQYCHKERKLRML